MKQISFESILSLDPASLPVSMSTGQELGPIGLGTVSVFNPVKLEEAPKYPTKDHPFPTLAMRPSLGFFLGTTKYQLESMTLSDLTDIRQTAMMMNSLMSPATAADIVAAFRKMTLIYPETIKSDEAFDAIAECWVEDLAKYPADIIQEGCRLWRTSGERFLPTTGNIIALIDKIFWGRGVYARNAIGHLKHIEWRLKNATQNLSE